RERGVEQLPVDLVRGAEREHFGVVDQHVDLLHLMCEALHILEALEVGAHEPRPSTVVYERVDDLAPPLLVTPGDDDIGPGSGKGAGGCLADPGGPAGHRHCLVLYGHSCFSLQSLDSLVHPHDADYWILPAVRS